MGLRLSPPERRSVRRLTRALAVLSVVLIGLAFAPLPGVASFPWSIPGLRWLVFLVLPTILAVSVLIEAAIDWPAISSPAVGLLAVLVLWIVFASIWTLATPTPDGGVFFGFLFIAYAVAVLVAAIVLRAAIRHLARNRRLPTIADLVPL